MPELETPPVEQVQPPLPATAVEPVTTETPAEPTSVADHAAQFSPQRARDEDTGRFVREPRERHRAKSQQASPDDVKVIGELTKELRETEAALAKIRPSQGSDSPRVIALRRQIRGLKAELDEAQPPAPAVAPPRQAPAPAAPVPASRQSSPSLQGKTFDEPEPKIEDFSDQPDPYTAWQRALGRHDRRKEAFEAQQATEKQQSEAEQQQAHQAMMQTHWTRLQAFKQQHPDFDQKLQQVMAQDNSVPPILFHAIATDDNGPAMMYHLLDHPDQLDELRLLASSLPATDPSVALLRRRLQSLSRSQAVNTGSAVATPSHVIAPRPPNPVRTGPIKTGDEPPGEGHSIADHAKYWTPKPRR